MVPDEEILDSISIEIAGSGQRPADVTIAAVGLACNEDSALALDRV